MPLDRTRIWTGTINEQALDPQPRSPSRSVVSVSYTHLTLPTIYSV